MTMRDLAPATALNKYNGDILSSVKAYTRSPRLLNLVEFIQRRTHFVSEKKKH